MKGSQCGSHSAGGRMTLSRKRLRKVIAAAISDLAMLSFSGPRRRLPMTRRGLTTTALASDFYGTELSGALFDGRSLINKPALRRAPEQPRRRHGDGLYRGSHGHPSPIQGSNHN